MRLRDLTDDHPAPAGVPALSGVVALSGVAALSGVLVVVPARDEEAEIAGCLRDVAAAAAGAKLPVVVSVVVHRCSDRTAEVVAAVTDRHPGVHWVVDSSDAGSLGGARSAGVAAGRRHPALGSLAPATVWLANTDADSRVPRTWLARQHAAADRGLDLVLGTVEPRDDDSAATRLWHAQHRLAEGHTAIHGANLGVRLSAYDRAGGFPELDDGEDVHLAHAVRDLGLPWTSTDRTRVITSSRRHGRAGQGFAGFLRQLDDVVARS